MRPTFIEVEIDIRHSPEAVFDYCSDLSHEPEWNPMMKRIEKLTDGPIGVGARYATEFTKGPLMVSSTPATSVRNCGPRLAIQPP
jgi:uncharacterized protein YndB with AHSA1/START domain